MPIDGADNGGSGVEAGGRKREMESSALSFVVDRFFILRILLAILVLLFFKRVGVTKYPGSGKSSKPFTDCC